MNTNFSPVPRVIGLGQGIFSGLVLAFMTLPILVIVPLSFNAQPYFTFTKAMLTLHGDAYSLRWYQDMLENGMSDPAQAKWTSSYLLDIWQHGRWIQAARNSVFVGMVSATIATVLGTMAAIGINEANLPFKRAIMACILSPMIVPIIVTSTALYFFFSKIGITYTYTGIILAHTLLGVPFVVITVTATLANFDRSLIRAAATLGANRIVTFRRVMLPLILPGVIAGALFSFITSFDEVVAVIFLAGPEQRTIPRQMWSGIREQISPTILAVATVLIVLAGLFLALLAIIRHEGEKVRGRAGE